MAIEEADLIIVGGTSLSVYPASSLLYNTNGKILCLINNQPTSFDSSATLVIRDDLKGCLKASAFNIRHLTNLRALMRFNTQYKTFQKILAIALV